MLRKKFSLNIKENLTQGETVSLFYKVFNISIIHYLLKYIYIQK